MPGSSSICYQAIKATEFESNFLRMPRPSGKDFSQSCEEVYAECVQRCCLAQWKSSKGFHLPESFTDTDGIAPDLRPLNEICESLGATIEEQGSRRYAPPWWLAGLLWGPDDTAGLTSPAELNELVRRMHRFKFLEVALSSCYKGSSVDEMIKLAQFLENQAVRGVWLLGFRRDS